MTIGLISEEIISEQELRARLANYEDPFVERKSAGDVKDCLKTAIAFANSLPTGMPGVMFIPVKNDGSIQSDVNLDDLQRSIARRLADAFPDIAYFQRIITINCQQVLAVIVPGSPQRPHFAGHSYVRAGSQSVKASATEFEALIARRSSEVDELNKWVGKPVTMHWLRPHYQGGPRVVNVFEAEVIACTRWWLTLKYLDNTTLTTESFTLGRVQLSFDHKKNRLIVEIET